MKIIKVKEKEQPRVWMTRCECGACGSVLEVEESDLGRYHYRTPCGAVGWNYAVFVCLNCAAFNKVSTPSELLHKLRIVGAEPYERVYEAKILVMRGGTV